MAGSRFAFLPSVLFTTRVPAMPQPADLLTVVPFLSLARELAALLVPIQPSTQFRSDLERSLLASARQQNAQIWLTGRSSDDLLMIDRDGFERRWVLGAAAVGSAVSIAGIVAYVWRRRSDRAA